MFSLLVHSFVPQRYIFPIRNIEGYVYKEDLTGYVRFFLLYGSIVGDGSPFECTKESACSSDEHVVQHDRHQS